MNNHCVQKNSVVVQKKDEWLTNHTVRHKLQWRAVFVFHFLGQADVTPQACDFLGLNALCLWVAPSVSQV